MMVDLDTLRGLAVAVGIGLLVGVERERRRAEDGHGVAGVRTFALIALAGALAEQVGGIGIALAGGFVALAALAAYRGSRDADPGLTTEVAMLVVFLLGVLAMRELALAAGLGVGVALLLAAKSRVHRFVQRVLTDQELHDALLLAAAAAIVLPLLPDRSLDPWQVLNLRKLWLLAVLVMAINAAGHVALRAFGPRAGLLLAGLAGGFVSSTATIGGMGARARRLPALATASASGAIASNVSTIVQIGIVVAALAPGLLVPLAWPLLSAGAVVLALAGVAAWTSRVADGHDGVLEGRAFEPRQVLLFVAVVAAVLVGSAAMLAWLGPAALEATLAVSGLADVHAATASAAQLAATGRIAPAQAVQGIVLALATNSAMKLGVAWATGGRGFALRLLPGILAMVLVFAGVAWAAP